MAGKCSAVAQVSFDILPGFIVESLHIKGVHISSLRRISGVQMRIFFVQLRTLFLIPFVGCNTVYICGDFDVVTAFSVRTSQSL